jgi:tetratricopeptide (TPR) repeat protein
MWFSRVSLRAGIVFTGAVLLGAALGRASDPVTQRVALTQINTALENGEADKALALVGSLPQGGAGSAEAQMLKCRVRFTLQQWAAASGACQEAVNLDGENSNYHLWLGRALGEWADRATFLIAFSLGKRVRAEFETAVRLDPRNPAALSDLGSYYMDAPSLMGGGIGKAQGIADQLEGVDSARAHQLRAEIAEQRKDYVSAEREFRLAVTSSPHPAEQWSVLASFFGRRQQWTQMEWAIHNCLAAAERDPDSGVGLYDGAGVLIRARRDPELAAKMLEDYLAGDSKSDEAPAFVAHWRLARLLEQLGDSAGATREQAAGYALAHEYRPPQEQPRER